MQPGMSWSVPEGSNKLLGIVNAIVFNVCLCCLFVVFCVMKLARTSIDIAVLLLCFRMKLLDIINAIVLNVCSCCSVLCFVL